MSTQNVVDPIDTEAIANEVGRARLAYIHIPGRNVQATESSDSEAQSMQPKLAEPTGHSIYHPRVTDTEMQSNRHTYIASACAFIHQIVQSHYFCSLL